MTTYSDVEVRNRKTLVVGTSVMVCAGFLTSSSTGLLQSVLVGITVAGSVLAIYATMVLTISALQERATLVATSEDLLQ